MPKSGDIVLAKLQFTDTFEIKTRPALVLFNDCSNLVVAGITSNTGMKGIPLSRKEGAIKESVIKLNYIFTISEEMVSKVLFCLSREKKKAVYDALLLELQELASD